MISGFVSNYMLLLYCVISFCLLSGVFLSSGLLFLFLVLMIRLGDNCVFVNFGFLSYIFVAFMKSLMRWIMFLCVRSDGFIDVF